ncbi:MAG: condensation domain-containing protein, partial [Betaproteobacteria bacterium]
MKSLTGHQRVLSYGQIRFWTLAQIEGATGSYNMPAALRLKGELSVNALKLALHDVLDRHEPLRTFIVNVDGEPQGYVQEIEPEASVLLVEDLRDRAKLARDLEVQKIIQRDSAAPFDLSRDLMLRARLLKLSAQEHVLVLVMHHIASDGVSVGLFFQELTQAYSARVKGQAPSWSALEVSYADYAAWQREWLESSGELQIQSESWRAQLRGIPEQLSLPVDYERDPNRSRLAGYERIEISAQTARVLQSLANTHRTTVFTVMIALFGAFLGRLSNQTDVVVGSPVAGRTIDQVEGLIGFFVNSLALRVDASDSPDLHGLIERAKASITHALEHQDLPFDRLVEDLGVSRSLSHTPVFQAMLVWQADENSAITLEGLELDLLPVSLERAKFDITLSVSPNADGSLSGVIDYDASLFLAGRVTQWGKSFLRLLDQTEAFACTSEPVSAWSLVDESERSTVTAFSAGELHPKSGVWPSTMVELFSAQAAATPEAVALICERDGQTERLSYAELEARSNQL